MEGRLMEFWKFLQDVFNTWVEKVGIILTILPFIEKIPRVRAWLQEKPILERFVPLLWVVGILCMVGGFYSAWHDQYHAALSAEAELNSKYIPDLIGELEDITVAPGGENNQDVISFVVTKITNRGAQSIADHFSVEILRDTGESRPAQILNQHESMIRLAIPKGPTLILRPDDYLPRKAGVQLIPTNGAAEGFIPILIEGIPREEIFNGKTKVKFTFKDALGKSYSVERPVGPRQRVFGLQGLQKQQ
jgi:hypothetical protein